MNVAIQHEGEKFAIKCTSDGCDFYKAASTQWGAELVASYHRINQPAGHRCKVTSK